MEQAKQNWGHPCRQECLLSDEGGDLKQETYGSQPADWLTRSPRSELLQPRLCQNGAGYLTCHWGSCAWYIFAWCKGGWILWAPGGWLNRYIRESADDLQMMCFIQYCGPENKKNYLRNVAGWSHLKLNDLLSMTQEKLTRKKLKISRIGKGKMYKYHKSDIFLCVQCKL